MLSSAPFASLRLQISRLLPVAETLALALLVANCGPSTPENYVSPEEAETPLSDLSAIFDGAPANASLPNDNKADAVYPAKFDLIEFQSAVKSQGARGTCTIFAATALMENLYITAGLPAEQADFSEQYLNWSVKTQVGDFPNTGGSNARSNLLAINRYGIPKEAFWPYESRQWGSVQDAECSGSKELPTRCYTNGAPPQSAAPEALFRLPAGRWLNTNSIKAQMTAKKQAVVVGVEFFYQAWNHGASGLPINGDYQRQGYVTYPNAADLEASRKKPAGHGILLLGWDDTLSVASRDGQGELVTDAEGNPVMETGFFLFKNSWGTSSFGIQNPFGAGYGYISMKYIEEFATAYVSDLPQVEVAMEICDDGADNNGDGLIDCADPSCAQTSQCVAPSPTDTLTFSSDPGVAIPDNDPAGVTSTIQSADTGKVEAVSVTVMITHSYRGDLKVELIHKAQGASAETVTVLHDQTGGGAADLLQTYSVTDLQGQLVAGDWSLRVSDHAAHDTGSLDSWELELLRTP